MDPSEPSLQEITVPGKEALAQACRHWVVERVDSVIVIPEPELTLKKWRTSCGVIARARVSITRLEWFDVTEAERETLYAKLKQSFRVPDEAKEEFW